MTWHAKRFYVRAAVVPARTGSFSPWHTHPHPQAQQASTARGLALQEEVKKVGNQNQRGATRLEKRVRLPLPAPRPCTAATQHPSVSTPGPSGMASVRRGGEGAIIRR